jgi:hypothetical protein
MRRVPISCARCGWKLGFGSPGAFMPCVHCGCWMAAKAMNGEFEEVAAGIAVVAVFAFLAVAAAAIVGAVLSSSSG